MSGPILAPLAFPAGDQREWEPNFGMSLRDYFVAHAPPAPESWQVHPMPALEPMTEGDAQQLLLDRLQRWKDSCRAWEVERQVLWAFAWAEQALERRQFLIEIGQPEVLKAGEPDPD